jgi:co-chaperonin GroES (HSP10)
MPTATGWHILIGIRKIAEKTKGGIVIPEEYRKSEQDYQVVAKVLDVGPQAYYGMPAPWCKKDDYIFIQAYSGQKVHTKDEEYKDWDLRLIEDKWVKCIAGPKDMPLDKDYLDTGEIL